MEKSIFHRPQRRKSGFTLIEILVVIAIIAILAGAFVVAAGPAINAAKRAKANVIANQIQTAILNYYTEYGVYPVDPALTSGQDIIYKVPTGSTQSSPAQVLMFALCGNINPYNPSAPPSPLPASAIQNTRDIAYLTPKRTDVDSNGVLLNPFSSGSTYYYFGIAMDADYDGVLGSSNAAAPPNFSGWATGSAMPGGANITQGVAVWACCDPNNLATPNSSTTPNFWVHTY